MRRIFAMLLLLTTTAAAFAYYAVDPVRVTGASLIAMGEETGAEETLIKGLRENPSDLEAWELLGTLYEKDERLEESLVAFGKAASLRPDDPDRAYKVALIELRLNRLDACDTGVRAILARFPFHRPTLRLGGWLALKRAAIDAENIDGFHPHEDELRRADASFRLALAAAERDTEALLGRAVVAQWRGAWAESLEWLNRGLAVDTGAYWLWQLQGEAYSRLGRRDEALVSYEAAVPFAATRPYTLLALAGLNREEEDYAAAIRSAAQNDFRGLYGEGMDYLASGAPDTAERIFRLALAYAPEDEMVLDRIEEARMASSAPVDTERIELAARRIEDGGRAEQVHDVLRAYADYHRSARLAPQRSAVRLRLARFYNRQKLYSAALRELERVVELTRSQEEMLAASDLMEVITRSVMNELESAHRVNLGSLRREPLDALVAIMSRPERLEERMQWSLLPPRRPGIRLAILPLKEVRTPVHTGVGRSVAAYLGENLAFNTGFDFVPMEQIVQSLKRHGAAMAGDFDPGPVAAEVGAEIVIAGRIFESEEKVTVEVKVLRAPDGPVLERITLTRQGPEALSRCLVELLYRLNDAVPVAGNLIRRQGSSAVTVNLGRASGVVVGDTLVFTRPRRDLFLAGFDWPVERTEVLAQGRVTAVTEHYCEVAPGAGAAMLRAGDRAERPGRPRL